MAARGKAARTGTDRFVLDASLRRLAYRCWPNGCPRDRTCCVGLYVEVSRREVRAIDSLMDELASIVPSLRSEGEYENVFIDEPPAFAIESQEDGACPFLFRTRQSSLCSIHHLALATGRRVESWKPAACRHWPLLLVAEDGRVRVTVQPAARQIGCVAPLAELPGQPSILEAYRAEIEEICGPDVLRRKT
jgi:hypothetical protein